VHNSHLALLAALVLVFPLLRLVLPPGRRPGWGALKLPAAAVAVGLAGNLAYSAVVTAVFDRALLSRPHISAHLADMGPGAEMLQARCPQVGLALCAHAERLPMDWIAFLFDSNAETGVFAAVPLEEKIALQAEQTRFLLETLRFDPVGTLGGLMGDGLHQLWTLSLEDTALDVEELHFIERSFPPDVAAAIRGSRIFHATGFAEGLSRVALATGVLAAGALVVWGLRGTPAFAPPQAQAARLRMLVAVLLAGVVLNALICGILASPYGRFQARIVWLLPFAALLAYAHPLAAVLQHGFSARERLR